MFLWAFEVGVAVQLEQRAVEAAAGSFLVVDV
jgi:hypothetical protein